MDFIVLAYDFATGFGLDDLDRELDFIDLAGDIASGFELDDVDREFDFLVLEHELHVELDLLGVLELCLPRESASEPR